MCCLRFVLSGLVIIITTMIISLIPIKIMILVINFLPTHRLQLTVPTASEFARQACGLLQLLHHGPLFDRIGPERTSAEACVCMCLPPNTLTYHRHLPRIHVPADPSIEIYGHHHETSRSDSARLSVFACSTFNFPLRHKLLMWNARAQRWYGQILLGHLRPC